VKHATRKQRLSPCLAAAVVLLSAPLARAADASDKPARYTILGRINEPAGGGVKVDWSAGEGWIRSYQPAIKPPEGLSAQERFQWYQRWSQSEAGKAFQASQREYALKLRPDGSFRVDDVPAGHYALSVRVPEPSDPRQPRFAGRLLGSVTYYFTVPETSEARDARPLDLGSLEPKVVKRLRVGDPAPSFEVEALDGKGRVKLEDYRGKYVLVSFWATWCRPCHDQVPYLKRVAEAFGKDNRFVLLGLSWDHSREEARQYVATNGLGWAQGLLGDTRTNDAGRKVVEDYDLGLPSNWLIGPDGKVVARDLLGEAILEFVAKSLNKPR